MATRRKPRLTARTADRYQLYSGSVQTTEAEIAFFTRVFRKHNNRPPRLIREDFCGTALISCDWVKAGPHNRAIGVDLDPEPLAYCRKHYLPTLAAEQARRLRLCRANVLDVRTPPVDVIAALNFSFCVFKKRPHLLRYFRRCLAALKPGGLMVLDLYGGPESQQTGKEKTRYKGFTYVWDQADFNPITHEALNHIHFLFPDGSRMRKAFTYDWRLWTPVELVEALEEAGFGHTRVYWEGTGSDGEGNGIFRPSARVCQEPAWIAYVVGIC
ncbi:MAG TPA: class I SAM-dependent methyltransferase [Phycisphaerae bacterium]|nr:class I SAM-dependent methyltransferase [Phycisphaerae bacterium]